MFGLGEDARPSVEKSGSRMHSAIDVLTWISLGAVSLAREQDTHIHVALCFFQALHDILDDLVDVAHTFQLFAQGSLS